MDVQAAFAGGPAAVAWDGGAATMPEPTSPPKGQRDHSGARPTRHARERLGERFGVAPGEAEATLREILSRTRRLGTNADNGAVALLAVFRSRPIVAILQGDTCLTVLTWPQFEPRLPEFGRPRVPRKWGRTLRRLAEDGGHGDVSRADGADGIET